MRPDLILLGVLIAVSLFAAWLDHDSARWLERKKPGCTRKNPPPLDESLWSELHAIAKKTIQDTIAGLPAQLKAQAEKLPCLFRDWSHPETSPAMGHYFGFRPKRLSDYNGPIILYLGAIHRQSLRTGREFADQVRVTYLHEFGHHLGWDEADLAKRGLA